MLPEPQSGPSRIGLRDLGCAGLSGLWERFVICFSADRVYLQSELWLIVWLAGFLYVLATTRTTMETVVGLLGGTVGPILCTSNVRPSRRFRG